jgi:hypothetical protein
MVDGFFVAVSLFAGFATRATALDGRRLGALLARCFILRKTSIELMT